MRNHGPPQKRHLKTFFLIVVIVFSSYTTAFSGGNTNNSTIPYSIFGKLKQFSINLVSYEIALYKGIGYSILAKEWGDTDDAHIKASYLWGYDVGDPTIVENIRMGTETIQFFSYNLLNNMNFSDKYDPTQISLEKGGLLDSALDVEVSIMGASDRVAGKEPSPPTALTAQELTGLKELQRQLEEGETLW